MITIRLFRIGKKRQPSYKIVVTDKKNSPSGGRFIDEVGFYDPITKNRSIDGEKVKYWVSKGASVSDTVHNLLVKEGVIEEKKRPKHNIPEKKEEETTPETNKTPKPAAQEAPVKTVEPAPVAQEAPAEEPVSEEVSEPEKKEE